MSNTNTMRTDPDGNATYATDRTGTGDGGRRGRHADGPREIPARGWLDVLFRVKTDAKEDNITLLGGGIAFFSVLSLFPAIAAMVAIYGLVSDPADVARQVDQLGGTVPPEARQVLTDQLNAVVNTGHGALGLSAVIGILLALWSASAAVKHLIVATTIAYDEEESRGYLKLRGIAVLLTVVGVVFFTAVLIMTTALPDIADNIGGDTARTAASVLRWPILIVMMLAALAVIYRVAPDRDNPKWRWTTWGAAVATALWIAASAAFAFYRSHFGSYNKTYGALASVIILMLWLYITALCVILGAEINSELEHQTAKDSTVGLDKPLGQRDAEAADTVGPTFEEARGR